MCYTVFIATPTPQPTTEFVEGVSKICLSVPEACRLEGLAGKFTLPYVYHVGAHGGCSCGFSFQSQFTPPTRFLPKKTFENLQKTAVFNRLFAEFLSKSSKKRTDFGKINYYRPKTSRFDAALTLLSGTLSSPCPPPQHHVIPNLFREPTRQVNGMQSH